VHEVIDDGVLLGDCTCLQLKFLQRRSHLTILKHSVFNLNCFESLMPLTFFVCQSIKISAFLASFKT